MRKKAETLNGKDSSGIFQIEDGRVLAEGTHSELLESCEAYRILYGEESVAA